MSLQRRFVAGDEELGKKDDDHYRGEPSVMASPTTTIFTWRGPRRKRILLATAVFLILYLFVKNLPTDTVPARNRQGLRFPPSGSQQHAPAAPKSPPPRSDSSVDNRRYFEGPIKYYNLASSFGAGLGPVHDNRNVLFVVSNLKSAASLLPLACDMSKQNKNRVHLMLTGRDEMAIHDIEKINGVSEADCSVKWHDGRPDFSIYSTDYRMEVSVRASLGHISSVMRPRVVLIDSPEREDAFLSRGIKDKTRDLGLPLIELPINAAENLKWISKLDSNSLKAWNEINVDILIHAPPESSGSLIRLLLSLKNADYFGFPPPRLTVELPNNIDPPTSEYLANFQWPHGIHAGNSKLTLRHRLLSNHVDAQQASLRQIESFYPSNVARSNVLVLSPQVELSPLYFHYLIYTLLEYKYSTAALHTSDNLLGISLEKPTTALNNKALLATLEEESLRSLFLYQAPTSHAALYFGDKWVELHSFLSNRFAVDENLRKPSANAYEISEKYPSWLSYLLELSRARAYTMLYPSLASPEDAFATIHTELHQPPKEHTQPPTTTSSPSPTPTPEDSPVLTASSELTSIQSPHNTHQPLTMPRSILHLLNPQLPATDSGGPLPNLSTLPILAHTGEYLSQGQVSLNQASLTYAETFARDLGGCQPDGGDADGEGKKKETKALARPKWKPWSANDLFCLEEEMVERGVGVGQMPSMGMGEGDGREGEDVQKDDTGHAMHVR
jgi:hypothetical protein